MKFISVFVVDGLIVVSFDVSGGFRGRSRVYYDVSPRSLDRLAGCVMRCGAEIRPFLAGCVGYTAAIRKGGEDD